jgi:hypothetical protein
MQELAEGSKNEFHAIDITSGHFMIPRVQNALRPHAAQR